MIQPPLLPFSFANKFSLLAVHDGNEQVVISYSDETPLQAISEACRALSWDAHFVKLPKEEIQSEIGRAYKAGSGDLEGIGELQTDDLDELLGESGSEDLLDSQDDAPVIRMINTLFTQALKQKASDIHLETFENDMAVRFRIDGVLQEVLKPDYRWAPRLVSRIKVMAKLDIAEKRVPQDGRVSLRMAGQALDVRVSTMPSIHGERVVLRLLEKEAKQFELSQLGMPSQTVDQFKKLLNEPNGIILVTGPTGSGKTTTLYAGLSLLNEKSRNILTIEDPVEYAIPGVGQTPVNSKTGMTFAKGLKAILRQDPDVVMIGEIRDGETAEIAVQASLTGHLVLSTLHTNDALGAIVRLMDIGVEPYLIASSLKGVLAQRLVRSLCQHCKRSTFLDKVNAERLSIAELTGAEIYQANGCEHCNNSGYTGRIGVYELLTVNAELARMINNRASEHEMYALAKQNTRSLFSEAGNLIIEGRTSVEEVLRVIKDSTDHALV